MADEGTVNLIMTLQREGVKTTEKATMTCSLTVAGGKVLMTNKVDGLSFLQYNVRVRLIDIVSAATLTNGSVIFLYPMKDGGEVGEAIPGSVINPALDSPHIGVSKWFPAGSKIQFRIQQES